MKWSIESYASEAAKYSTLHEIWPQTPEVAVDAAIKLTTAVLVKYFDEAVGMIRTEPAIYVDSSFQGASDGSELSPFHSVSQALHAVSHGKPIAIAGVHPGNYVINMPCTLSSFFIDRGAIIGQ